MAHEVTDTDQVFSVRKQMWWDLAGTHTLDQYPTRKEAQKLVHPWEPISEPLYRKRIEVRDDDTYEWFEVEPEVQLNVRSDNGASLGPVSDTRGTVTNTELWDIAETLQGGSEDVMFETAGSLQGGRKVWILIRLREPLQIKGDPNGTVIPYYALQNGHNTEAGAFRGQATKVRVVCANTSKAADADAQAQGTEFVFRHTKNVRERVEEARQALAGWRDSIVRWQALQERLVASQITESEMHVFIEEFIPQPAPGSVSKRVHSNVDRAQGELLAILRGSTCEGISHTAYGLVQASIEYMNHVQKARTAETRFKRAYLERNNVVTQAQDLACSIAGVTL